MPLTVVVYEGEAVRMEICRHARELFWRDEQNALGTEEEMEALLATLPRGSEIQGVEAAFRSSSDDPT